MEYANAGIPEYWIVRPEVGKTEVYLEPVDGNYAQQIDYPADQPIHSTALPGFVFNLNEALKG